MRSSLATLSRALVFPCVIALIACLVGPVAAVTCTELVTPNPGDVLDNGCIDRSDSIHWAFDWTDCPGATAYHLYVQHAGALGPAIDDNTLLSSDYVSDEAGSYILDAKRFDWRWKVQAFVDGQWGEWTAERSFDVEPLSTDCSSTPVKKRTWGKLKSLYH